MHRSHGGARVALCLLAATLLAALPLMAHALGLGRLVVQSGLDEPLNGQIELISPTTQEIKTLKASLASREDFDIAGVDRSANLFDIKYAVGQHTNGQYFLKLTTDQAVREPFLHFLIQVEWSGGRLIREYSALLDPPNWVAGRPADLDVPATTESPESAAADVAPTVAEVVPPPAEQAPPTPAVPADAAAEAAAAEKTQLAAGEPAAPPTESKTETPAAVATQPEAAAPEAAAPAPETAAASDSTSPATESETPATLVEKPIETGEHAPPVAEASAAPEAAAPAPEAVPASAAALEFGPVKKGETLIQVAAKVNPDRALSSQQVMIALLRANPSAFFENNVNNLKTGKILKVPQRDAIAAISKTQAEREFRAQYDAWQEYKLKLAGASRAVKVAAVDEAKPAARPEAKKAGAGKAEKAGKAAKSAKAEPVDLLKIVRANLEQEVAEETTKTPGVETKKEAGKEQRVLTDRVATLEEAIESKQMQNKEMRERVGKLQEQVKNTERLINLENKDLAQAQKQAAGKQAADAKAALEKAAQEKAALEKAAQEQAAAEATAKSAQEKAAHDKAAAETASKVAQAAKPTDAPKPPVVAKKPVPQPQPQPEENFLDVLLSSLADNKLVLAMLGGVGVLALGMAGMYAYRRRRASREFSESILSGASLTTDASLSDTSGQAAASDTSFLSDFSQGGMGNIHTDEVDPIAEAEVYLAYGRDEQAEEILKDAVVKDPVRHELKGKLLEIYYQRNDIAAFETLAEELYAALEGKGGKVWDKVEEMGRKLSPSNPMFRGGTPATKAASAAAAPTTLLMTESQPMSVGAAARLPGESLPAETLEFESAAAPASSGLDFNIGLDTAPTHSQTPSAFDMSFDLGNAAPADAAGGGATSGFNMDFSLGEGAGADTSSNLIDFSVPGKPETAAEASSGLDFTLEESAPAPAGNTIDFPSGGLSAMELESAPPAEVGAAEAALPGWDETATKLDLAKAYIDMGDAEGARSILDEVMAEGNDTQKKQARDLAAQIAA